MKINRIFTLMVTALMAMALMAACGGKKASTPTEAFKSFYEASKSKDVATLKRLMSKDTLAEMEKEAKGENKSVDQFLSDESQKGLPATLPETRNEKIDGDKATVEVKGESNNWHPFPFVKEDGEWKIAMK